MRIAALVLALCLLLTGCQTAEPPAAPQREAAILAPIETPADPAGCTPIPVYLNGVLLARGYEKAGNCYLPLTPLCEKAHVSFDWEKTSKGFRLNLNDLHVEGRDGREYFTASSRYIYAPEGWLIRGEELLLPTETVCRLFGIKAENDGEALRLTARKFSMMQGGTDYYAINAPEEDIYWLAHIISAEAKGEPLVGQIAVGNVVLNRVRSELFPDTVFGVIYDTDHAIQFEPIALGSIMEEPTEQAWVAAYLALEGTDIVGSSLYFVNPKYASSWFDDSLELVARIGRHNFYDRKD